MSKLSYRDAGVDIAAGDELVERLKPLAESTRRPGVLGGIGAFGAFFSLRDLAKEGRGYADPILVSGCDGVGTKLKLAFMSNEHRTVGIDLVAMSVNDILCHGAEPLYFLDYFATSRLDVNQAAAVIAGIVEGCKLAGCGLAGGETAELPGFYHDNEYDLAGFAVGVVERDRLLPLTTIATGDALVGLASSGLHSNGYALARKLVFDKLGLTLESPFAGQSVRSALLQPTRIYVRSVLALLAKIEVKGIAHITGGGLLENLPRILPSATKARVNLGAWPRSPLFTALAQASGLENDELYRSFNMGIGLVLVVAPSDLETTLQHLREVGEEPYLIGEVVKGEGEARVELVLPTTGKG